MRGNGPRLREELDCASGPALDSSSRLASRLARSAAFRRPSTPARISLRSSQGSACSDCSFSAVSGVRSLCAALATNVRCAIELADLRVERFDARLQFLRHVGPRAGSDCLQLRSRNVFR